MESAIQEPARFDVASTQPSTIELEHVQISSIHLTANDRIRKVSIYGKSLTNVADLTRFVQLQRLALDVTALNELRPTLPTTIVGLNVIIGRSQSAFRAVDVRHLREWLTSYMNRRTLHVYLESRRWGLANLDDNLELRKTNLVSGWLIPSEPANNNQLLPRTNFHTFNEGNVPITTANKEYSEIFFCEILLSFRQSK